MPAWREQGKNLPLLFVLILHSVGFVVSADLQHRICSIRAMKDAQMQRTLLEEKVGPAKRYPLLEEKGGPAKRYPLFLDIYDN